MPSSGPMIAPSEVDQPVGDVDIDPDRPWVVIVWNDPINLMSYVTFVLQKLFGYPREVAEKLMLQVHYEGRYQVRLRPSERALMSELVQQLREQLLASTDDPSVRRLFPPAYPDDAERDAGYQVLTRDELLEHRLAALDVVERTLDGSELDEAGMTSWMSTLNSLRLVLGTRLDVDEEPRELDENDPEAGAYAVYEYLGWVLSQIVDTLSADLPPPSAPLV